MANAMTAKEADCKMVRITSLTTMRSQDESTEAALLSPNVKRSHIGEHKVNPITVRRVLFCIPVSGNWVLPVKSALRFAFIIHTIKPNNTLKKNVQLGVGARVPSYLKQGLKNICYDLLEVLHHTAGLVHIIQAWHLDEPTDIGGKQFVIYHPGG